MKQTKARRETEKEAKRNREIEKSLQSHNLVNKGITDEKSKYESQVTAVRESGVWSAWFTFEIHTARMGKHAERPSARRQRSQSRSTAGVNGY